MKSFKSLLILIIGLFFALSVPQQFVNGYTALTLAAFMAIAFLIPAKKRYGAIAGVVTQFGLQEAFQRARNQIYVANLPNGSESGASSDQISYAKAQASNAVLSQSNLRLVQPLTANLNIFNFPVQVDQPPVSSAEIRLQKQDAFFCSNIAFYITKAASAADVSYKTLTYPDIVTWPVGGGAGGLFTVYNGEMVITINKSVIVPAYPMLNFLQIPQTQNIAAVTGQQNQFDPSQVSLWEPTINFIGTKQNQLQIQLPGNMTAAVEAFTYGIFELQGVLAQNVTLFT